jgi:RHS repeat-associated protein
MRSEVDANSQALTQRYYAPFGDPLGTTGTGSFPGSLGYVGGTTDAMTGLTNLGAREYDPAVPAFISPDPLLDPTNPSDLDPYAYAYNNPVINEDPTGQTVNTYQACANDDANCGTSTGTPSLPPRAAGATSSAALSTAITRPSSPPSPSQANSLASSRATP